jgi:polar amino acid transport system substrate-binding protein
LLQPGNGCSGTLTRWEFELFRPDYVSDQKIKINGWNSFLMTPYRFEYRTGVRVAQVSIPSDIPQEQISVIRTTEQGLQKLALGRTDVYIDFDERVKWTMRMQALLRDGRIFRSGTIQQVQIYAYLSRQRAALAPELAAVLRAMKQEGVIANYERIMRNDSDWVMASR